MTEANRRYRKSWLTKVGECDLRYAKHRLQQLNNSSPYPVDSSPEEVAEFLKKDCCDSCGKSLDLSERCIDHDHTTHKVRGILCRNCNTAEGLLGSIEKLDALRAYMVRTKR